MSCLPIQKTPNKSGHWTSGILRDLQAVFYTSAFFCFQAFSQPAHLPLTQTVETVEKVPFQKLLLKSGKETLKSV